MYLKTNAPIIVFILLCPILFYGQRLTFEKTSDGLLLQEGGENRFFYHTQPPDTLKQFARSNYVHPLYGLDGEILTEDFPEDHPHHHGIFWSWHQLYADGKRIGDPWLNENINWEVVEVHTRVGKKTARLESEILWSFNPNSKAVIRENLIITYKRLHKNAYIVVFDISLTALVDEVAIGGSEDLKGYGGFSARLKLPKEVKFFSEEGEVHSQNLAIKTGGWINIVGKFNPSSNRKSAVSIMGEPDHLPGYKGWILRDSNSMQNMAFPGQEAISIAKGEKISFRNQLLVHRNLHKKAIQKIYTDFRKLSRENIK